MYQTPTAWPSQKKSAVHSAQLFSDIPIWEEKPPLPTPKVYYYGFHFPAETSGMDGAWSLDPGVKGSLDHRQDIDELTQLAGLQDR